MATRLFHVSDQAGIQTFHPRTRNDGASVVWAMSDEPLPNYLVPRDCPRVTFWRGPETMDEDANRFLVGSRHVMAIEQAWFQKCLESKVFLYEFNPSSFEPVDLSAGYYTSTESVKPVAEHEVSDIFKSLFCRGVEGFKVALKCRDEFRLAPRKRIQRTGGMYDGSGGNK